MTKNNLKKKYFIFFFKSNLNFKLKYNKNKMILNKINVIQSQ